MVKSRLNDQTYSASFFVQRVGQTCYYCFAPFPNFYICVAKMFALVRCLCCYTQKRQAGYLENRGN